MTIASEPSSLENPRRVGNAGTALLAWLVILACCGWVIWDANRLPSEDETANQPVQLSLAAELTAKMVVGLADWSPEAREMILDQARALEQEGVPGQVARSVLAAELNGLELAREELATARTQAAEIETNAERQEQLNALIGILDRLYAEDATRTAREDLADDDRTMLETHLGWVGRLAPIVRPLADGDPERESLIAPLRRMPFVMIAFLGWLGVCLVGGLAAIITLLVMGLMNKLRHGFGGKSSAGAVYAEVFAVWTMLFVGGRYVAEKMELSGLPATLAVTIGALIIALTWGLIRGVGWRQMRQDLGIHSGRGIVAESFAGIMTYCMAIPLLGVGLVMTIGLMALQEKLTPNAPAPSHPVQEFVASGDWVVILQTMFLAAIVAPLVEETIFRGALYRHLRDGTHALGLIGSCVVSAGVSSVLFAAIHPQGWPFIPVLASLAVAFCLAREWRGSLWPGMVAHGVNNFVIMTLNVLLLAP